MGQITKSKERIRPVVNRTDLKYYAKLESQRNSRLAPFHRNWTLQNFIQILRVKNVMAQSYVCPSSERLLEKEEVAGFVLYRIHENHFEILNLCADLDRPDVIYKLLDMIKKKTNSQRPFVEFTVRETDQEWHDMLSGAGFLAKLVRKYSDRPLEDGYKFRWDNICCQ